MNGPANHALRSDRAPRWTHGDSIRVRLIQSFRRFRRPRGG